MGTRTMLKCAPVGPNRAPMICFSEVELLISSADDWVIAPPKPAIFCMETDGFTVTVGRDPLVFPNDRLGCRASLAFCTSEPPDVSVSVTLTVLLPGVHIYVAMELGGSDTENDWPL